jgi:hypothetical protein
MVEFYVHSERLQFFLGQVSGVPQDNGAVFVAVLLLVIVVAVLNVLQEVGLSTR